MKLYPYRQYRKWLVVVIIILLLGAGIYVCKHLGPREQAAPKITLYLSKENRTVSLDLEEYIAGTVAAEMPASFEMEALKAQAVCARTYTLRKIMQGKKYPLGANLSDDIKTCQAYLSKAEFNQRHSPKKNLYAKINRAVKATRGEIMVYNDEPIDALYHSTCGGYTASAVEVWGQDFPYLQSIKCNYCQSSHYYKTEQVVSVKDFSWIKKAGKPEVLILEKTASGRIKKLKLNNQILTGEEFRNLFKLPSYWWKFETQEDKLIIHSRGYGHGVGLCQYGANGMALEGKNYHQILYAYYRDFNICKLSY